MRLFWQLFRGNRAIHKGKPSLPEGSSILNIKNYLITVLTHREGHEKQQWFAGSSVGHLAALFSCSMADVLQAVREMTDQGYEFRIGKAPDEILYFRDALAEESLRA